MIEQGITVKGNIKIVVTDESGAKQTWNYKNILTSWGLSAIASALAGTPISPDISYLAVGDGVNAATINDISLESELFRVPAVVSKLTGADANKVSFYYLWAEGVVTGTFTEVGLFDADTAGNMFNRRVFSSVTVGASNTLEITWTIEFDNA